jgi:hypothetical protein
MRKRRMVLRWRRHDVTHNLLKATRDFVRARNGNLLIVGPIEIQDWMDGAGKFKVAIGCLGKKPEKQEKP